MTPLTPQKPADTRPPNKPSTPPPPKQPTQPSKPSDSWLEPILDADLSDSGRGGKDTDGAVAPRPVLTAERGFTLPLRPPWPGRPFPVYTLPAEVWQPSTPGQPPTPPPPDPHPQD